MLIGTDDFKFYILQQSKIKYKHEKDQFTLKIYTFLLKNILNKTVE